MNADPALPVSKGNDAEVIQKIKSGSFPEIIRGIFHHTALHIDKFENRFRDAASRSSFSTVQSGLKREPVSHSGDFSRSAIQGEC